MKTKHHSEYFGWDDLVKAIDVPIKDRDQFTSPNRFDYARYFGVNPTTIDRWKKKGLPWIAADHVAIKKVGIHPSLIWPQWFPA